MFPTLRERKRKEKRKGMEGKGWKDKGKKGREGEREEQTRYVLGREASGYQLEQL